MHELRAETHIDSPPDVVWAVLADLSAYARWNPFIVEASGALEVGSRLSVRIKPPGRRPMRFAPTVTQLQPATLLEWQGSLGVRGLFDGAHRFELHPTDDGGTRFVQAETFTGLLVRPFQRMLRDTAAGFELMNRALSARAERH